MQALNIFQSQLNARSWTYFHGGDDAELDTLPLVLHDELRMLAINHDRDVNLAVAIGGFLLSGCHDIEVAAHDLRLRLRDVERHQAQLRLGAHQRDEEAGHDGDGGQHEVLHQGT